MAESIQPGGIEPKVGGGFRRELGPESRVYPTTFDVFTRFEVYRYAVENPDVRSDVLDFVEATTAIRSTGHILELGCSGATDLINLRTDRGYSSRLTGLDTDEILFVAGKDKINRQNLSDIELIVGIAEDLSFIEDNSLDAVMAWYMLYETDSKQVLSEVWRKLKPGGLFLITTHGEFNIPVHRRIERLISMATEGRIKPPIIKSRLFTAEIAAQLLTEQGFQEVQDFHAHGPITIPPEAKSVYRDSIYTRRNEFTPAPLPHQWKKIMSDIVDPYIESEIAIYGYVLDFMDRWGAVYQKPLESLTVA